jgi:hypothetical protein
MTKEVAMTDAQPPAPKPTGLTALQTTAIDLASAALIVAGVALIFIPAAFILAGLAGLAISWRATR